MPPTLKTFMKEFVVTPEQIRIKASNEKWLNREKPLYSTPQYKIEQKIKRMSIGGLNASWTKKFETVRG